MVRMCLLLNITARSYIASNEGSDANVLQSFRCSHIHSMEAVESPGTEIIKVISCSTQLSTKFILLMKIKMPTNVGILTFFLHDKYEPHWRHCVVVLEEDTFLLA